MHILVFPGWYPSKVNALSGDFVQRHLQAISLNCTITAIIAVKNSSIKKSETVVIQNGNLTEQYFYYPSLSSIKWLDGLLSFIYYNYICIKASKKIIQQKSVDLVHLYILQKNHFIGLMLQTLFKIPYVISEQSTFYIDGQFEQMNLLKTRVYKFVFKKAASFHAVSKFLANAIKTKLQLKKEGVIIPNVVDARLFYYNYQQVNDIITFVHVSNMVYQKNVEGMLEAFNKVKKNNPNFVLNLVGPLPSDVAETIKALSLQNHVVIWNERKYTEVAEIMQKSDVFVFFTRYETFGCVIIEANACGLPVLLSDLAVTRELVAENENGMFVQNENVEDLAEKILIMMNNFRNFDPLAISLQSINKFNYQKVSEQFSCWYRSIIN